MVLAHFKHCYGKMLIIYCMSPFLKRKTISLGKDVDVQMDIWQAVVLFGL